jgi:DNA-binding GntR family transcriptional regulator
VIRASIAERIVESILARKLRPGERLGEQELAELSAARWYARP